MEPLTAARIVPAALRLAAALCIALPAVAQQAPERRAGTPFSQENAHAILRHLAKDIGPRPMGSPAEQRALAFAVQHFRDAGCDTAYVMPFTAAGGDNTTSGVAVGVAKGRTGRVIVLGGHIDSAGPEIPGANDDGSGTAVVLEAARVLAPRDLASTLLFCAWGGEERGLHGSEYFVRNYGELDSVVLMLQVDMANGGRSLNADPDASDGLSAPSWLLEAAFDVFYRELGGRGLVYRTAGATFNSAVSEMSSSDHAPFIAAGIPAIDFTSDISDPIHTPLDTWERFNPEGLKRSGDLAVKLVERFDGGVPSRTTERYLPIQAGTRIITVPYGVVWAVVGAALVLAFLALRRLRRTDRERGPHPRVRFSGLKILLFLLIVSFGVWQIETLAGFLLGWRAPWVNNGAWYVLLGLLGGSVALWACVRLARRWPLSPRAFPPMVRTAVLFVPATLLLALRGPEAALFAAWPLLFFSLAVLVRSPFAKSLFSVLAFLPAVALVAGEGTGLLQRALAGGTAAPGLLPFLLREGAFVLFSALLFLPHAHALAAVVNSGEGEWLPLAWLGRPAVPFVSGAAAAILIALLATRPVYGGDWAVTVRAEQTGRVGDTTSLLLLTGSERLDGLRLKDGERDTVLSGPGRSFLWTPRNPSLAGLGLVEVTESRLLDSMEAGRVQLRRTLRLDAPVRPYTVNVSLSADSAFEAASPFVFRPPPRMGGDPGTKTIRWYSFPSMPIEVPVTFTAPPGSRLVTRVEMTFATLASGVEFAVENAYLIPRTVLTWSDTLVAPRLP